MKYIVLSLINFLAVFVVSFLMWRFIFRKIGKRPSTFIRILVSVLTAIIFFVIIGLIYFDDHYAADETALEVLKREDGIKVSETDKFLFVDGKGTEDCLIFYPGAKVDSAAYLPLMARLAENGLDCFVVKPPLRFAQFATTAAGKIIKAYDYETVIVSGHSLGGVVSSIYAGAHSDLVDGLVLLGSYPISDLDDQIQLLTIYGSEDLILNRKEYERSRSRFPVNFQELIIEGGNHANFGNYGKQEADGEAGISRDSQQKITADAILELVSRCKGN